MAVKNFYTVETDYTLRERHYDTKDDLFYLQDRWIILYYDEEEQIWMAVDKEYGSSIAAGIDFGSCLELAQKRLKDHSSIEVAFANVEEQIIANGLKLPINE